MKSLKRGQHLEIPIKLWKHYITLERLDWKEKQSALALAFQKHTKLYPGLLEQPYTPSTFAQFLLKSNTLAAHQFHKQSEKPGSFCFNVEAD